MQLVKTEMERQVCVNPSRLPNGVEVACRECNMCRQNRVNDFVGRGLAEKLSASSTLSLTLTYRGTGVNAIVHNYIDVRRMLARLRKDGYSVRYICAGEFGALKGRAHWHMILYFRGKSPEVEINSRVLWKYWPHGLVYFQHPDARGLRYVLKYTLKREGDNIIPLRISKKPPIGYDFFMGLADDMVRQGLPMRSAEYSIAGEKTYHTKDKKYHHAKFWLQGRMREMFFERYVNGWRETYNTEPPETDYIYEKYLDPIAREEMYCDPFLMERDMLARQKAFKRVPEPAVSYARQVAYLLTPGDNPGCCVLYSDGSAVYTEGKEKWHLHTSEQRSGGVTGINLQLCRIPLAPRLIPLIGEWLHTNSLTRCIPSPELNRG